MKFRPVIFGLAIAIGLGSAIGACGDDNPSLASDGNNGSGSDAGPQDGSFTAFVIDLVNNHSMDTAPTPYSSFKDLPDPDGSANNTHAYDGLF